MIHLNPIEYPKFNSRQLRILKVDTYTHPSGTQYKRLKIDLSGQQVRTYYGKRLLLFADNTNPYTKVDSKCFYGRYTIEQTNTQINHYLLIEDSKNYNFTTSSVIHVFETFAVVDENQVITFQDLQEKFESNKVKADVDIFGINDIGSNNIVNGYQTEKINQSLYDFKTKLKYDCIISKNNVTPQFVFRLHDNELNRFKIFLHDRTVNAKYLINLELCIDGFCKYCWVKNNSHFEQENGFYNEKNQFNTLARPVTNFQLQLRKSIKGQECYLQVILSFDANIETVLNTTGYISCKHPEDLWITTIGTTESNVILNGTTDRIKIDQTLLFVDSYGEQRTVDYGETLIKSFPLTQNIVDKPVGFYHIVKVDGLPQDVPGGAKDVSRYSENNVNIDKNYFATLEWEYANLTVYHNDHYLLVTNNYHLFIGKKSGLKNIEWRLMTVEGHTHNTDNLIEGNINKFVRQEWINNWNDAVSQIVNSTWKPYNTEVTPNNVHTYIPNIGEAIVIVNDPTFNSNNPQIYIKNGSQGSPKPIGIGALKVEGNFVDKPWEDGFLIKASTLDKLQGLGIGLRIPNTDKYILISNSTNQYNTDTNKFFDLVKRTHNDITVGNNSLNIGIDNEIATDNSVLYGVGLNTFSNLKQTIFGCYNKLTEADIIFGNGTSISDRKNAFWYGNDTFIINGKIKLDNYDDDLILVNNGEPIINNFAKQDEVIELRKIVESLDSSYIITGYKELNSKATFTNYVRIKSIDDFELYGIIYDALNISTNEEGNKIYSIKPGISIYYVDFSDTENCTLENGTVVGPNSSESLIQQIEGSLNELATNDYNSFVDYCKEETSEDGDTEYVIKTEISYLSRLRIVNNGVTKLFKVWEHFDLINPKLEYEITV